MELYLIRHGETRWNVENRLQGIIDIPLNENGIKVAKEVGEKMKDIHFDVVFASPLLRAQKTAKLVLNGKDTPIINDYRLVEMDFGRDEGWTYEKWHAESSPYLVFVTEPEKYVAPIGSETLEHLCERTKAVIQQRVEPLYGKCERVMIVAHGCSNKAIVTYLENRTPEQFWDGEILKNCEAAIYSYDGEKWSKK